MKSDFTDIFSKLYFNREKVFNNINIESIIVYNFIKDAFKNSNISENHVFRFMFSSFYGLNAAKISQDFKENYFRTMEKYRDYQQVPCLEDIIESFDKSESFQFSFITKLMHTLDNNKPIYDSRVAKVFSFKPPYQERDWNKKAHIYNKFYNDLNDFYSFFFDRDTSYGLLNEFDDKYEKFGKISNAKKLDFLLWTAGKIVNTVHVA
ncbi:hypothetical protein [Leptospira stimsonii]|uniref:Uncharacterized protein n=1 Tax=Leptospira stimsonii TaxID=2202203 RepID=A0A396Z7G3_9LEPT|nr:hypothetical protein [Leptospira stimsonii]RHX89040.1 hypothetical protein DLM75_14330 [Leptospira stimsonii]